MGRSTQLHAAYAGLRLTRPTRDVDMILHIESGAATFAGVQQEWGRLGYVLHEPVGDGPVHRFARGSHDAETIEVMVADRLSPKQHPQGGTKDSVRSSRRYLSAAQGGEL